MTMRLKVTCTRKDGITQGVDALYGIDMDRLNEIDIFALIDRAICSLATSINIQIDASEDMFDVMKSQSRDRPVSGLRISYRTYPIEIRMTQNATI